MGVAVEICGNTRGGVLPITPSVKNHILARTSIALCRIYAAGPLHICPPSFARRSSVHLQLLLNGTRCTLHLTLPAPWGWLMM